MRPRTAAVTGLFDGAVRSTLHIDQDSSGLRIARLDHSNCADVLKYAQETRDGGGTRDTELGRGELVIDALELAKLKRKYPDLAAPDREIRHRAWQRFIGSAEARPWRTSKPRYFTAGRRGNSPALGDQRADEPSASQKVEIATARGT